MKNFTFFLTTFLALFLFVELTHSQVYMVVKGEVSTPYYDLEEAIEAAEEGATVYIPTGPYDIQKTLEIAGGYHSSTLLIDKKIYLVGAGAEVGVLHNTIIRGNVVLTAEASGSQFHGIVITGELRLDNVSNTYFKRCKVNSTIHLSGSGDLNIISESDINNVYNNESLYGGVGRPSNGITTKILIHNNIIRGIISNLKDAIFNNNVFTYNGNNLTMYTSWCIFSSNVFFILNATLDIDDSYGNTYNNFNNNLFHRDFRAPSQSSNCMVSNNIENVPLGNIFVDQVKWQLTDDSPGKNAGSDGTDVGIYGGISPAKEDRIPIYPSIKEFLVGSTTDSEGNLQVRIKAEAQEN